MRKLFPIIAILCLFCSAWAEKSYMSLYMNGNRIGYSVSETIPDTSYMSQNRSDSKTVMSAGLLGTGLQVSISSKSWTDLKGNPTRMEFKVESSGRTQKTTATFGDKDISVEVDNNGSITNRTVAKPQDAKIVDDAVNALFLDGGQGAKSYYVLDPMTASLVKNDVKVVGPANVTAKGQAFKATKITVTEPRAETHVFMSSKGDLIKVEGPMGIEMFPSTEKEALAPITERSAGTDLAFSTSLKPEGEIGNVSTIKRLRLEVTGKSLNKLPNDAHQSIKQVGDKWIIEVHPVQLNRTTTVDDAVAKKPEWVRPSFNLSSDDPEIVEAALKAVGDAKTVAEATERIRSSVFRMMKPNAGIGVLRDAKEVLATKEGVCRDYATLAGAMLRAAEVPTRMVSGLVLQDGQYYYHAWVEVWDGNLWVGIDPTRDESVGAGHIKLAHGNVEEAFTFTLLEKAKIKVLNVVRR